MHDLLPWEKQTSRNNEQKALFVWSDLHTFQNQRIAYDLQIFVRFSLINSWRIQIYNRFETGGSLAKLRNRIETLVLMKLVSFPYVKHAHTTVSFLT